MKNKDLQEFLQQYPKDFESITERLENETHRND